MAQTKMRLLPYNAIAMLMHSVEQNKFRSPLFCFPYMVGERKPVPGFIVFARSATAAQNSSSSNSSSGKGGGVRKGDDDMQPANFRDRGIGRPKKASNIRTKVFDYKMRNNNVSNKKIPM